jgi:hypothetical protein
MHVTQDRDLWPAFVNTVMNLRFPLKVGNFSNSCANEVLRKDFATWEMEFKLRRGRSRKMDNLYLSPYIISMINQDDMGGPCSTNEEVTILHRILVGKSEGWDRLWDKVFTQDEKFLDQLNDCQLFKKDLVSPVY